MIVVDQIEWPPLGGVRPELLEDEELWVTVCVMGEKWAGK